MTRIHRRLALAALGLLVAVVVTGSVVLFAQQRTTTPPPSRVPISPSQLEMKITEPFTVASIGDIIAYTPFAHFGDQGFQSLLKILRDADVAIANMESSIVDRSRFAGYIAGQNGPKEIAADVKSMGLDLVNRANNHTFDMAAAGMYETNRNLTEVGVVPAGAGQTLEEARAPGFLDAPKGRVGLVGMFSIDDPSYNRTAATARDGSLGGAPGLNPLRLTTHNVVTADQFQALKNIRDAVHARRREVIHPINPVPANEPADRLLLFEKWYKSGPETGLLSYTMNQGDLDGILRSIRNGKYYADFMVAMIHCHQNTRAFQAYSMDNDVPDFLVELAHKAIDNGADLFMASGVHALRGVEIYKGKPIFYGLSNFIYHINYGGAGSGDRDETRAEENDRTQAWLTTPTSTGVLLATSRFEGGRLSEVRLNPVDVGSKGRALSQFGIPLVPSPEEARRILTLMQSNSKRFGTTIAIEGNIGVIRVPAGATPPPSITSSR